MAQNKIQRLGVKHLEVKMVCSLGGGSVPVPIRVLASNPTGYAVRVETYFEVGRKEGRRQGGGGEGILYLNNEVCLPWWGASFVVAGCIYISVYWYIIYSIVVQTDCCYSTVQYSSSGLEASWGHVVHIFGLIPLQTLIEKKYYYSSIDRRCVMP